MRKCWKCNEHVNANANFCFKCGANLNQPVVQQDASSRKAKEKICPECSTKVALQSKFCNHCGHRFTGNDLTVTPTEESVTVKNNYITWHVLPGQLAVKIDEDDISSYGNVNGLYLTPGTTALLFVDGKFVDTLESAKYDFASLSKSIEPQPIIPEANNPSEGFFSKLACFIKNGFEKLFGKKKTHPNFYSIVLIRTTSFQLIYDFDNIQTQNLRCTVGLNILCKITNLNEFFELHMSDRKFLTAESFAKTLSESIFAILNRELKDTPTDEISHNEDLANVLLQKFRETVQTSYPYINVTSIVDLTTDRAELENIREKKEALYIDEKELEVTHMRNDFLNKLQNEKYRHDLDTARSYVDFKTLMDKVDQDKMLAEDEKARFVMMLEAERKLREAKSENETVIALNELRQSRMLSEEELAKLQRDILHRAAIDTEDKRHALDMLSMHNLHEESIADLKNAQETDLLEQKHKHELDKNELEQELTVGNKRHENEIVNKRLDDTYSDERRDKERAHANADRDSEYEHWHRKMNDKLEMLQKVRDINEKRDQAQHLRDMDVKKLDIDAENARMNADIEKTKVYAGMTAEQIMAANPDISPAVAQAWAEKYKAEAVIAQNSKVEDILTRQNEALMALHNQQTQLAMHVIDSANAAHATELDRRQAELDRVHADAERHQDRFVDGMKTTVKAVADPIGSHPSAPQRQILSKPQAVAQPKEEVAFCSNCGTPIPKGSFACDKCGAVQ